MDIDAVIKSIDGLTTVVGEMRDHQRKQNGEISEINASVKLLMDRTSFCKERGDQIIRLEERMGFSGKWLDRAVMVVIALIQTGIAVWVVRSVNQVLGQGAIP
jgi:hypothetical protein